MYLLFSYLSIMLLFIKHPISMSMILFMQSILMSIHMGLFSLNFWFSYMMMLVMIGGMLILFMYMTSIASNEKFKFNWNLMIFSLMMIILSTYYNNFNNNFLMKFNNLLEFKFSLSKYFFFPKNLILILIILYLLITMIATIKICKINKGPLRQNF